MANLNQNTNSFKDVGHIVKFNGDNHLDWKYEFLGIMEQLGLKNLIEPTAVGGQVLSLPNEVIHTFIHHVLNYRKPIYKSDIYFFLPYTFLLNDNHSETLQLWFYSFISISQFTSLMFSQFMY